jgi:hypothetical protein
MTMASRPTAASEKSNANCPSDKISRLLQTFSMGFDCMHLFEFIWRERRSLNRVSVLCPDSDVAS